MASVTYHQVTKSFGSFDVIKGVDLDIRDGEFVVFVGPSGCGKSTLLRMLAGLEDVTSGTLKIGDTRVNDIPAKKRNIAMVFQNYALYPHMRVAMGRAIVRDPDVFLMDEPLSNLDAKLRTQMRVEIRKLQRRLGTTMIYVTHDQVEAMTLADRIAVLDGGYVQQFGRPAELYHAPCNKFVAGFLGSPSINFIRCAPGSDNMLQMPDGQNIPLPAERAEAIKDVSGIDIGIRPEEITVLEKGAAKPSEPGLMVWESEVSLSEALGGEILVYVTLGGQNMIVKVPDRDDVGEGSMVTLTFRMDKAHMFSANSGELLSLGARD